jgi:hypothetical protein
MNQGQNVQLRQIDPYMSQQILGRQENTLGEHDLRGNWHANDKGPDCEVIGHVD